MRRSLLLLAFLPFFFVTGPAAASVACDLRMTLSCTNPVNGASTCTATTLNAGSNVCSGDYSVGFVAEVPPSLVTLSGSDNGLGLHDCFDSGDFEGPEAASVFSFCFGEASLGAGDSFRSHLTIQAKAGTPSPLPLIAFTVVADPVTADNLAFAYAMNGVALPTCTPNASVASVTQSGVAYTVSWSAVSDPQTAYIVEESTSADFSANVNSVTVQGLSRTFTHDVAQTTTYYYRVRAQNCGGAPGENSAPVAISVQGPPPPSARNVDAVVPVGSTTPVRVPVTFSFTNLGKTALDSTFTASTDQPYLTVTPPSGTIPPNGQLQLNVIANPSTLPPGANTGTIKVTTNSGGTATLPFSISLVTPVTPGGKSLPAPNTLIIPIVTHVNGAGGPFVSDVRLTNTAAGSTDYSISFTPTQSDGTKVGKVTSVTVNGGQTIALNDIVKDFFGYGASGGANDFGFGALEIRPLNSGTPTTFASSRTYVTTAEGTLGQFIPALPFSSFITRANALPIPGASTSGTVMSLQQVAQSSRFRTNLGLVEGSGQPASGQILVYNDRDLLKTIPYSLMPGEHRQINNFLTINGITNLEDGRIEITIESESGAVTAYASVLDNLTSDPLAVIPVQTSKVSATRFVLPGIADLTGGLANFHSDIRILNGGNIPITATLTYYPQHDPAHAKTAVPLDIAPHEVRALDNVLPTLFGTTGTGGSVVVTTTSPSSLVTTARTYSIGANGGTYGLFIPGITSAEGAGAGDRPLQVLQLEQSQTYRTNLGLVELTGRPVDVRVTLNVPDSKVSPIVDIHLEGNEFNQLGNIIGSMLPGKNVYNARIAVEVTGGTGRVAAYGAVIDNATQDPTYVPAQ